MFTVYAYDDATCDDIIVFSGSLNACKTFVSNNNDDDDLYIVSSDGFTVID